MDCNPLKPHFLQRANYPSVIRHQQRRRKKKTERRGFNPSEIWFNLKSKRRRRICSQTARSSILRGIFQHRPCSNSHSPQREHSQTHGTDIGDSRCDIPLWQRLNHNTTNLWGNRLWYFTTSVAQRKRSYPMKTCSSYSPYWPEEELYEVTMLNSLDNHYCP